MCSGWMFLIFGERALMSLPARAKGIPLITNNSLVRSLSGGFQSLMNRRLVFKPTGGVVVMKAVILAFPEKKWENYTIPVNGEPVVKLTEGRLLMSKRIDEVLTIVRKDKLRTYSLHVANPLPVQAGGKMEALLKVMPDGPFFLAEGNMPLVMPFLVNYLIGFFYENEPEALIPLWKDGTAEVTHAVYEPDALADAIEAALAEGYRNLGRVTEFLDYEPVSIEELSKRNPKVTLSFFRVKNSFDVRFAERTLKGLH